MEDERSTDWRQSGNRRRSERVPLDAIVHYEIGGSQFINMASNISSEGIFIKNFSPPPVGTELKVKVKLPPHLGGVPIRLVGKVVRVVDGVGLEGRGMGVEFTAVEADSLDAVRMFVKHVYELDDGQEPGITKDDLSGKWQYQPRPQDVLRITTTPPGDADSLRSRVLKSVALVLVGILIGGGIFLFWMFFD